MFVKKFTGNTLDETIKLIKREMGPDAIILKTITNKGIKGIVKKNRIEITAAISEKEYLKKSKVDNVLNDNEKDKFYNNSARKINNSIDNYNNINANDGDGVNGYGNLSLNKRVLQENFTNSFESLDEFLGGDDVRPQSFETIKVADGNNNKVSGVVDEKKDLIIQSDKINNNISALTKRVNELESLYKSNKTSKPKGLHQMQMNLMCLNLDEAFTQELIRKAIFELSDDELNDYDIVLDFVLREITSKINIDPPLFSLSEMQDKSVITVLFSGVSSGRTSIMLKLGSLKKDSVLISYKHNVDKNNIDFVTKMLNVEVLLTNSIAELFSICRKKIKEKKNIIIDFSNIDNDFSEANKFKEDIKNSFDNVEILFCLSAINSESFNKKLLNQGKNYVDGIIFNFLDQCGNYAEILNVHLHYPKIPIKFFGTGPVIPEDIETASTERIISGLFEINE